MTNSNFKYNVGEKVRVVDNGASFSTWRDMAKICSKLSNTSLDKWKWNEISHNGDIGTIIAKHKHPSSYYGANYYVYYIDIENKYYLIGERGIVAAPIDFFEENEFEI